MKTNAGNEGLSGLTADEVVASRLLHGENRIVSVTKNAWWDAVKGAVQEPMLVLLAVASVLYFIHGDLAEAIFLLVAIVAVYSISHFQKSRSERALQALKKLTQPRCKVMRDGDVIEITSEELVIGDLLIVEEGSLIAADAVLLQANDFTVNESVLTGESLPVEKSISTPTNIIYQGTLVTTGLAIGRVSAIGKNTQVGLIGNRLEEVSESISPLQQQINSFVKKMAAVGILVFIVIWGINIYHTQSVVDSLLNSLTLAMSILPEEIPVAFATFMALGAWRLMQIGVIVKDTRTVETLGSAAVICVDKTGTITKNEMALEQVYVHAARRVFHRTERSDVKNVVTMAMWASEPIPFDPMEKAIHNLYAECSDIDLRSTFSMVKEYPLSGKPPIMTHVFGNDRGELIIASKGAPEAILRQSNLTTQERETVVREVEAMTSQGYRVLGVALAQQIHPLPAGQSSFEFTFLGLLAFFDPPKENIREVLSKFYDAGIRVKIITGDNLNTTRTIATQVGFRGTEHAIVGEELMLLGDRELDQVVNRVNIFARMFPDAKLRVIQSFQRIAQVVAMTGDGVNDGPALKAANIGIAMGKKGSEIAKEASALILADDDLAKMVDAVAMGRKIYSNLKKAIQYIISIHIPIILIVFLPLVLGWTYPSIFTPVHVIFLELIMGPTCSIIYENEPMERNAMIRMPRNMSSTFFSFRELSTSIVQGLVITIGLSVVYGYAIINEYTRDMTTAVVFIALIVSNVTLTLVNRSFYYSVFTTLRYVNYLIPLAITVTIALVLLIFIVPPLRNFFSFTVPPLEGLLVALGVGFISVFWFEGFKAIRRKMNAELQS